MLQEHFAHNRLCLRLNVNFAHVERVGRLNEYKIAMNVASSTQIYIYATPRSKSFNSLSILPQKRAFSMSKL